MSSLGTLAHASRSPHPSLCRLISVHYSETEVPQASPVRAVSKGHQILVAVPIQPHIYVQEQVPRLLQIL